MSAEAIRQKLLGKFREVTRDRAERLAELVRKLEDGEADAPEELARELHTIKGEARMMGFTTISQLAHLAEDVLARGASDGVPSLRRLADSLSLLLDEDPEGGEGGRSLQSELQRVLEQPPNVAVSQPGPPAEENAPEPKAEPPEAEAAAKKPAPASRKRKEEAVVSASAAETTIRVDLDALDEIAGLAGDVLVEGAKSGARVRELASLLSSWTELSEGLLDLAEQVEDAGLHGTVEKIEGEVHSLRTRAFRFLHHHGESVGGVQRLLSTLAERVANARLLPLSTVFADLPEAARRMAAEQGKEVELTITGGEIGIDKAILPSLRDPLIHLLRNAIDHGLEKPDERAAVDKSPKGRLQIVAEPDGDRLLVHIVDDGRGIAPQWVRDVAVRKGVVDEAEAAALSDRAVLDLLFAPGFSTRDEAGATSGRGVGLDVVRKRVVSLGGSVGVESSPGIGTRFALRLPQSLSLMKVLLFRVDEDVYGLPSADVDAVGRLDPASVEEVAGIRAVRHRGWLLPVVAAGPLLALNGGPRTHRPTVAYVRHGDEGMALVVDGFHGEREVAVKAPGAFLKGMRYVAGAAALEDGRVALLLSPADLVTAVKKRGQLPSGQMRERRRILLVDDSLIAREAEAALLRALGHEVDEAADGEEGWKKLQAGRYDLVVSDVQMPLLDGIGLTRRIKGSDVLRSVPVVLLSSLETPLDRRRGAEAGADAYLGKSELSADKLGAVVGRLCGAPA